MGTGARKTRVVRGSRGLEGGRETGREEKVRKEKIVEEEGPAGAELDMGCRYDRPSTRFPGSLGLLSPMSELMVDWGRRR